ncbi:hypothetical protein J2Y03_002686 [Neobacillus niacini]|uniref:hypothetical protein n=1 Tax=Neobacillus niacini TaxID=86668 RepID=UPI00285F6F70|nr:hypothetical protein [Neobacillus niacini]MDR7077662.1 hypothetical protein [Neobacillus niacini]
MNEEEKDLKNTNGKKMNKTFKDLYGLDPEMSLLSANFAPSENPFLNEHYQEDSADNE